MSDDRDQDDTQRQQTTLFGEPAPSGGQSASGGRAKSSRPVSSLGGEGEVPEAARPLADRMRPRTLEEFIGQEHLVGPGKPLRTQIERDDTGSI
ncbi:MAG TPA: hypothetical protein VJQ45_11975, partial [Ktedonobacterales bacterium]|nr:hypothetical protein [Ktedonobacterales bacterium]